jgi:hypothetical protein
VTLRLRMFETAGDSRAAGRGRWVDEDEVSWKRLAGGAVLPVDDMVRGVGGGATFFRMVTVRVLILGLLGSNMVG